MNRDTRRGLGLLAVLVAGGAVVVAATSTRSPGPAARSAATASPDRSSSAAFLTVRLERDDGLAIDLPARPGATTAVVLVTVKGVVPETVDASGSPAGRGQDNLLGVEVDWGDGSVDRSASQSGCVLGAPLAELLSSVPVTHFYRRAGQYTVSVRVRACAPVGEVAQTLLLAAAAPSPVPSTSGAAGGAAPLRTGRPSS